jgi:hypothetical protein
VQIKLLETVGDDGGEGSKEEQTMLQNSNHPNLDQVRSLYTEWLDWSFSLLCVGLLGGAGEREREREREKGVAGGGTWKQQTQNGAAARKTPKNVLSVAVLLGSDKKSGQA